MLNLKLSQTLSWSMAVSALVLSLASIPALANEPGKGGAFAEGTGRVLRPMPAPGEAVPAPENSDGTRRAGVSPKDMEKYRQWADTSKARLEKAVRKADGETEAERIRILSDAIREVSMTSYNLHNGAELLMRFAMNQALDLTVGVPAENGVGVVRPGVLAGCGNASLMAKILSDSVQLALEFYIDDRKAVEAGSLLELPFNRFSTERLVAAYERWLPVVGDNWNVAYDLETAVLYQWVEAANHAQNPHATEMANEIYETGMLLQRLPAPPLRPARGQALAAIVRGDLRDHMQWLISQLRPRFGKDGSETK